VARRASTQRRPALGLLIFYTGLAVLLFSRAWASPRDTWIGDHGDPPLFMWFLRWHPYAVAHGMNPFFTHHIDSVHGVNLLWDTSVFLPSLALAPITLTLGPVMAFNVIQTASLALSAWCAYLCFRRYVTSHIAAATGALLYGFSPYAISHSHGGGVGLGIVFTPPLLFLLLDEILVRQHARPAILGAGLGGLAGAQLLISQEILATEAIAALFGVVILALVRPAEVRARLPYATRALGAALGVFVALAAIPVGLALFSSRRPHNGTLWGTDIYVSDTLGFVIPTSLQQLRYPGSENVTKTFTDACCIADAQTYIGFPMIALLAFAAVRNWSKTVVRVATLLGLAMLVLSLGPHLHVNGHTTSIPMPQSLLTSVPLLSNMLVSRLMLYFYLCAGLLVAVMLDGVWHRRERAPDQLQFDGMPRRPPRWSALLAIGAVVVAFAFLFPRTPFPATAAEVPRFFESAAVQRVPDRSVALVAPFARDTNTSEPMLWQAIAGMRYRMPEGYATGPDDNGKFSFLPIPTPLSERMEQIQQGHRRPPLTAKVRTELLAELRRDRVQTVIVGPFSEHDRMVAFFTRLFAARPETVDGVDVWWKVGRRTYPGRVSNSAPAVRRKGESDLEGHPERLER